MRKVMVIFEIIFIVIFIAVIFIMQSSYKDYYDKVKLTGIVIDINDSCNVSFVNKKEILLKLNSFNLKKGRTLVSEIPLNDIEVLISKDYYIKRAEAYCDVSGKLNIDVTQFVPTMRFIGNNGDSYFIDNEFRIVKHRNSVSMTLPMVTQEINIIPFLELSGKDVVPLEKRDKSSKLIYDRLAKLKYFSDYVSEDDVIENLISQVNINGDCEVEIIPRLGGHIVVLCDLDSLLDCDKYFDKLLKFYESQSSKGVWTEYSRVNLKFEGQVVCKKNK